MHKTQKQRVFELIRNAVLPEYRDRVDDYLGVYEESLLSEDADADDLRASAHQLRGYLLGLNTTRVLGMAAQAELDFRIVEVWL